MEPRFQQRKDQLLADCQVPPTAFRGAIHRLEIFAQPFVASLPSPESQQHTRTYLSDLEHKNAEAIACRHDLDRQTLQHYLGTSPWDHRPPMDGVFCVGHTSRILMVASTSNVCFDSLSSR